MVKGPRTFPSQTITIRRCVCEEVFSYFSCIISRSERAASFSRFVFVSCACVSSSFSFNESISATAVSRSFWRRASCPWNKSSFFSERLRGFLALGDLELSRGFCLGFKVRLKQKFKARLKKTFPLRYSFFLKYSFGIMKDSILALNTNSSLLNSILATKTNEVFKNCLDFILKRFSLDFRPLY